MCSIEKFQGTSNIVQLECILTHRDDSPRKSTDDSQDAAWFVTRSIKCFKKSVELFDFLKVCAFWYSMKYLKLYYILQGMRSLPFDFVCSDCGTASGVDESSPSNLAVVFCTFLKPIYVFILSHLSSST